MEGFFTKKQTSSSSRPDGRITSCASCGLYKSAKSPKQPIQGEGKKGIMIITESITESDDQKGVLLTGAGGRLLRTFLLAEGIDVYQDCWIISPCRCACYKDDINTRPPTTLEVANCRRYVLKVIEDRMPKLIISFGMVSLISLIGHRWKKDLDNMTRWRGWTIPDQDLRAWLCPTFSLEEVAESKKPEMEKLWRADVLKALEQVEKPFPVWKKPQIEIWHDLDGLQRLGGTIVFDYETTGIKPHAPGHKIICCSVAISEQTVVVFMMPKTRKELKPFLELMQNPDVEKIAQNLKFEDHWTNVRLKVPVVNWAWDTMLATHILDNRRGVTGLKFQTYVQFGVVDYSSEISPYLESKTGSNGINRIEELIQTEDGANKLLTYCALDSHFEFKLAMKQQGEMNYDGLPF
jgi:uracil-DNA glycosylase family 4